AGGNYEESEMRNLFLYMTTTVDGFVAGPEDELDWMRQVPDEDLTADIVELLSRADSGFLGYPVAIGMIPYWRSVESNPEASAANRAIAQTVNRLHPIVISNVDTELPWDNAELLVARDDAELVDAVIKLKREPGTDLSVAGGVRTAQRFARLGLVDEYVFLVHPVALGQGKPVFTHRADLALVDTKTYPSGIIRVRYRPLR
ncbi:MAG TPA: dihydrofolate reductase family protein, partial [Jiangellales bacterium]|nr:dihydrofolate reductase family protein [Jiangellales bacterium]